MSNLDIKGDDFPAAAEKMLKDAGVLHANRRYDGAAYLAGYAVECSLKTVLLIEAFARAVGATTTPSLAYALATAAPGVHDPTLKAIRYKVSHRVKDAIAIARGTKSEANLYACGKVTRPYLRNARSALAVLRWNPEKRYGAAGTVSSRTSLRWVRGAKSIVTCTVGAMRSHGVVTG